jgi:hypothetical protein
MAFVYAILRVNLRFLFNSRMKGMLFFGFSNKKSFPSGLRAGCLLSKNMKSTFPQKKIINPKIC